MSNKYLVPGAVVVAGLLIAGAVFFNGGDGSPANGTNDTDSQDDIAINSITADDHILGNPDAEIKIVEFSDIDCPFCANFHQTMNRIIDDYGQTGEVAWIYRHFPLAQLHPDAMIKAEASECVASLGGNDSFWGYLDILFEREDENRGDLADIAAEVGVNKSDFEECMDNNQFRDEVTQDLNDAQKAGGNGTPYSVIVIESTGETIALEGAQPYSAVKQVIEAILEQPGENQ